ncbi:hypothetical protein B0T24DRAFT_712026 [Lasiosphaeria ovina]|uniref:Uncharacterized protein n=1 Tax=Lasiosphaeria ovina TaxID=92902 RepID=A0AAE0JUU8_9PEZI|nr:hypothetical protein B0T24DRAFT_712026 [Lasiosphaeria ovina]
MHSHCHTSDITGASFHLFLHRIPLRGLTVPLRGPSASPPPSSSFGVLHPSEHYCLEKDSPFPASSTLSTMVVVTMRNSRGPPPVVLGVHLGAARAACPVADVAVVQAVPLCAAVPDRGREKHNSQDVLAPLGTTKRTRLRIFLYKDAELLDKKAEMECKMKEAKLFAKPEWAPIVKLGRTGVPALRAALQGGPAYRVRQAGTSQAESRSVKAAIRVPGHSQGYGGRQGPTQPVSASAQFLGRLASRFEGIVRDALEGRYESDPVFEDNPGMKLITKVRTLDEGFSSLMWRSGHTWTFGETSEQPSSPPSGSTDQVGEQIAKYEAIARESELRVSDLFIDEIYSQSRGPESGTIGGALLPLAFRKQAAKWSYFVQRHVQTVVVDVFLFIIELLQHVFVDKNLRDTIWEIALSASRGQETRWLLRAFQNHPTLKASLLGVLSGDPLGCDGRDRTAGACHGAAAAVTLQYGQQPQQQQLQQQQQPAATGFGAAGGLGAQAQNTTGGGLFGNN